MDTVPRRSSRITKGQKPQRLGIESTPLSAEEETLLGIQIEKTELELSLLKIRAKEAEVLRKSRQFPTAGGSSGVPARPRPAAKAREDVADDKALGDDAQDDLDGGASSVSTNYDGFRNLFKSATVPKENPNSESEDSDDPDYESDSDQSTNSRGRRRRSAIATAIREQSRKMNKFMSRQTLGKDLYEFDGNFQEYPMFMAWFSSTTASCKFTDQENLLRLQKCLKGEARKAVRFLLYSPECIDELLRVLEKKFGRPEFLVKSMIAEVKDIPAVKEEKPETVINLATTVLNLVASLKMSGKRNYIDNPQLLEELLSKLPLSLRVKWSEYASARSHCTLDTFSRWIDKRADAASERVQILSSKKDEKDTKRAKVVAATSEETSDTVTCDSCGGAHDLNSCADFLSLSIDDRWKLVKEKRLCFLCLKEGHHTQRCKKKKKSCSVDGCGRQHNDLLHQDRRPETPEAPEANVSTVAHTTVTQSTTLMKILPVIVNGPKGAVKTFAFLDEGSSITMMKTSLADELGLQGPTISLRWHGTTPQMTTSCKARVVDLKIKGTYSGAREYTLQRVRTVDNLTLPRQSVDLNSLTRDWRYLSQGGAESYENAEPQILVGLDNIAVITSREVIHGAWNTPYLARTWLGWVILGKMTAVPDGNSEVSCMMTESVDELHELVKQSFSTEGFGTSPQHETIRSRDEKKAMEIMERTTRKTSDGRYETGLLWRQGEPPNVPPSRTAALKRLHSTERKLDRNPDLAKAYCEKFEDHLQKGYLVRLSDSDRDTSSEKVWYLPHFSVENPAKKKVRVVFDCAAKSNGVCLNDLLLKGPDMLQSLPAILLNFRRGRFGFMGDIREMFHRVKLREEDQNYQRILYRGMDRDRDPEEFKLTVMTFGASCSPALAAYVKDENAKALVEDYPESVNEILKYTYCDDFISCSDSIEDAQKRIEEVIHIHQGAGFDVVNWSASDPAILNSLDASSQSKSLNDGTNLERVLGLWWDANRDAFLFKASFHKVAKELLTGEKVPTKREVLRVVMSIFDPLGFLGMFTVKGKILLQEIWRSQIDWDDEINGELLASWTLFLAELWQIETVNIPRSFSANLTHATSVELHVFGDASSSAFAAVAYLRIESEEKVETAFLCSRTRVAPLKTLTIPRLELQAAVLCSRLAHFVVSALHLPIHRTYNWSDSMTVLRWLRSGSRSFKTFVGNRVGEIEELTDLEYWKWVPTKENPADLATRTLPCDFSTDSKWFVGPRFLTQPKSEWPEEPLANQPIDDTEIKEFVNAQYEPRQPFIDATRFSSWNRLLRATARMCQIALFWHDFAKQRKEMGSVTFPSQWPAIAVEHLELAEVILWREMQRKYAPEEHRLTSGKEVDKESSLYQLSPFIDKTGLLRMKSRLVNSPDVDERFPIILDENHPATRLLILDAHERNLHCGREQVVNDLRRKFWIPKIRMAVKRSWRDCQRCKNLATLPIPPEMAALPAARVEQQVFPFSRSGIDFFGPIMVTVGRRQEKRWGALFTCMATRAIHLEIAHSLDTDSAIMAIRRFLARRGSVRELYSDNGTNFHGADNEMRSALMQMNHEKIRDTLSLKFIDWHFIPPAAPHMGGSWERLIRSVKTALKTTVAFHAPNDEVLLTLFAEAEFVINNRPLTHVSVDPGDATALTPNHFLLGRSGNDRPGVFDDSDLCLRRSWRKSQRLADIFWRRWVHEYLPELARRTKWYRNVPEIQTGSVVVIADEKLPRNDWPMGIVEDVYPGKDGKIRVVSVKTSKGTYKRPVARICVLDVGATAPGGELLQI